MKWGSQVETETRRRIRLSVWAYAYEYEAVSLVSDAIFDFEAMMVNLSVNTRRPDLDYWFRMNFKPYTGMWIRNHPELEKIKGLYYGLYGAKN